MIRPRKVGKRGFHRDAEATAAKGYKHTRSFVDLHGGEHLYGEDMTFRRQQVYNAAHGRCQSQESPHCRGWISWEGMEMDHIEGRINDNQDNLRAVCVPCHRFKHVHPKWTPKDGETIPF